MLSSGRQPKDFYAAMWKAISEVGHWQGEVWNKRKDGNEYLELLTINTVVNNSGDIERYVGTFSDITPLPKEGDRL
ncbi:PAS domain-containing protein [Sporosarcina thermotolerans]|uniref:PAS domain-containing protein n=1 Tax=Sporosarcina thermotolerans TaxID=633404 RepID=UPI00321AFBE1